MKLRYHTISASLKIFTFTLNTGLFTPYLDKFSDPFLAWFLFKPSTVYPCHNKKQFHQLSTSQQF